MRRWDWSQRSHLLQSGREHTYRVPAYDQVQFIISASLYMHSNITNKPTQPSSSPYDQSPKLNSDKRVYSFSESYDTGKQESQSIVRFIQNYEEIEQALNISLQIPYVMMINCQDQQLINKELLNNPNANKPIRERMTKYSQLIQYYSQGCAFLTNKQSKNQQKQYNIGSKSSNQEVKRVQQNEDSTKKLITSRYTRQQQLTSNKQPIINLTTKQASPKPYHSRSRSISSSHASNSKAFHKIQLKSVQRLNKKDSNVQNNVSKVQQLQQRESIKPQKQRQETKRYTISRRQQKQKQNKTISSRIDNLKNSRQNILTVSRSKNKSLNKSNVCENSRVNSQNRHKKEVDQQDSQTLKHQKFKTLYDMTHQGDKNQGYQHFLSKGNHIISETVQKSTDFLNMLKMMNQQQ